MWVPFFLLHFVLNRLITFRFYISRISFLWLYTLKDFVWWTNLSAGECKNAIDSIAGELTAERHNDDIYYIHQDCRTKGCRKKILLLPSYDEYLIGYKSRHHAIAEQFCRQAYNKNGIFYPVIVQNGEVLGNWHPSKKATFFENGNKVDISRLLSDFHQFLTSSL